MEKICKGCNKIKSFNEFQRLKLEKNRKYSSEAFKYSSKCRTCRNMDNKAWRMINPEKTHNAHLRNTFGLTTADYEIMAKLQNYICAICGEKSKMNHLSVDHCHKTGQIRKLLCERCNLVLGRIHDNLELADKIVKYLRSYQDANLAL